jgi:hypothetical protein
MAALSAVRAHSGTDGSNPLSSSEESVANLLQALRAVRFDGSRTGSDRILARIAFYARSGRRPASRSPAVARFQYLR